LKRAGLFEHAEHCLEVFDGRYCRAPLYLLDHPVATQLTESLGGGNHLARISFGDTNLLFIFSHITAHTLTDLVRIFSLKAQHVFDEGFNSLVHLLARFALRALPVPGRTRQHLLVLDGTLDGFNHVLDFDEALTQVFRVSAIVFFRQSFRDVASVRNLSISCCDQLLNVLIILSHSGSLLLIKLFAQQPPQLGDIRRNPPRLI
jgi:hypothetical protein